MSDDTRPRWPFQEFGTLTAHARGTWCKKIKGKIYYFGPWAVPDPNNEKAKAALQRYLAFAQSEAENTTTEVVLPVDLTLNVAVNQFLTTKLTAKNEGRLSDRQYTEYHAVGTLVLRTLGRDRLLTSLGPPDFARLRGVMSKRWGPVRLGNGITWVRSIFNLAQEYHGVAVKYGGQFEKPQMREVRDVAKPKDLFTPKELKALLKVASPAMKAMLLLGINGGFGQEDFSSLPADAVDWKRGAIDYFRNKTKVRRVVPLWPETLKALKAYTRPSPAHPELFFVTAHGNPWVHNKPKLDAGGRPIGNTHVDAVSWEFRKMCTEAGVKLRGPYNLRHTFRTQADATGDQNAIKVIMGQTFPGIDAYYLHLRGPTGWPRVKKVSDSVRTWLYGKGK